MTALLPPRFLFRYSFDVRRVDRLPRAGKRLLNLPAECALPLLGRMDEATDFAELRCAWNQHGFACGLTVTGRTTPPKPPESVAEATDVTRLWIDTRNTQTIHRAGRHCHEFELHPLGVDGPGSAPVVLPRTIARAREETPLCDPDLIPAQSGMLTDGYWLDVWFPAAALQGYDPVAQPYLGFYYAIQDAELGLQTLSVGREFPYASDPSLWSTLALVE